MKKIFIFPILVLISLVPSVMGAELGDINNDGSVDIADVVYLFKHRDVPLDDGDLNCDNSVDIADVVYLFKNYDKFREPVVFAKNLKLEPHWDKGYCYIEDADGNKFIALKEGATAPNIPDAKIIKIPLKSVASGDQILLGTAYLTKDNNITNSIKAMSYLRYIAPKWRNELPTLYNRYQNGEILDAGTWGNPKYDNIINISPDMVFIHKIKRTEPMIAKLDELGITYSRTGAYLEDSFMGKTEWIKFFAAFYGGDTYKKAENYFQETWKARNNVLRKVRGINTYPEVACFYWSSSKGPYVWGAQNFRNKWINDVKGEYVFNDMPGTGGEYMDKETFYERAMKADVVILDSMGKNITTKEQLLKLNPDFANFKAFKDNRFYVPPMIIQKKK